MKTTQITKENNHRPRNGIYKQMVRVDNSERKGQPLHDYSVSPTSKRKGKSTNQELKQCLRKYSNHQQDNWPELIPLAEYTYNTTKMQGTDFTPYQMVYGKTPMIHAAPGKSSQAAIDKIKKVAYKNLLYSQLLLQEHGNKRRKQATELRPGNKAYV